MFVHSNPEPYLIHPEDVTYAMLRVRCQLNEQLIMEKRISAFCYISEPAAPLSVYNGTDSNAVVALHFGAVCGK